MELHKSKESADISEDQLSNYEKRRGGREEAEQGKVQQHHLLVHRELHLNTLPEQVNTHLALRRNKIKQQILTIKESGRL